MMRVLEAAGRDTISITCAIGAAVYELGVREWFHRMSFEVAPLMVLVALWVLLVLGTNFLLTRVRLRGHATNASRIALVIAVLASVSVLFDLPFGRGAAASWPIAVLGALCVALVLGSSLLVMRLTDSAWRRLSGAVSVGFVLFAVSQPLLAASRAKNLVWPSGASGAVAGPTGKSTQVFLLFDELNASAAGPIIDVLKRNGLQVQVGAIAAVGKDTAQVIPTMFDSSGDFASAKACGFTSICGESVSLDFSKIRVNSDRADVVGFDFPYCAMQGLRFCERSTISPLPLDWSRWSCAFLLRLQLGPASTRDECAAVQRKRWEMLADSVVASLWRAPIWHAGGLLYAHVPLPHPPGNGPPASLKSDYHNSIARAAWLVDRIAMKAREQHIQDFTLVIFSDHPLRWQAWCETPVYFDHPCSANDALADNHVPLIVAGTVLPRTDAVRSNKEVFSLVASGADAGK